MDGVLITTEAARRALPKATWQERERRFLFCIMRTIHSKPFSIGHSSLYMNSYSPRPEIIVTPSDCYASIGPRCISALSAHGDALNS